MTIPIPHLAPGRIASPCGVKSPAGSSILQSVLLAEASFNFIEDEPEHAAFCNGEHCPAMMRVDVTDDTFTVTTYQLRKEGIALLDTFQICSGTDAAGTQKRRIKATPVDLHRGCLQRDGGFQWEGQNWR